MAVAFVQKTARFSASSATSVTSATLTTTAGNTGFLTFSQWVTTGPVAPTFSDSKGNTCTVDKNATDAVRVQSTIGSVPLTTAGTSHSWTVSLQSGTYCEGNVSEFSGVASSPLDQVASVVTAASVTSATATTPTTVLADEVVLACIVVNDNLNPANISDPPTTGYTSIGVQQDAITTIGYEGAYQVVSATGAQAATWAFGSGLGVAVVATYKAAADAGIPVLSAATAASITTTTAKPQVTLTF